MSHEYLVKLPLVNARSPLENGSLQDHVHFLEAPKKNTEEGHQLLY